MKEKTDQKKIIEQIREKCNKNKEKKMKITKDKII